VRGYSSFDPRGKLRPDELLYAIPAGETPPKFSTFAFQSNADVEEWATGAFQRGEFG
jgi:hypothetical protein